LLSFAPNWLARSPSSRLTDCLNHLAMKSTLNLALEGRILISVYQHAVQHVSLSYALLAGNQTPVGSVLVMLQFTINSKLQHFSLSEGTYHLSKGATSSIFCTAIFLTFGSSRAFFAIHYHPALSHSTDLESFCCLCGTGLTCLPVTQ
jgi:hypothetical protein